MQHRGDDDGRQDDQRHEAPQEPPGHPPGVVVPPTRCPLLLPYGPMWLMTLPAGHSRCCPLLHPLLGTASGLVVTHPSVLLLVGASNDQIRTRAMSIQRANGGCCWGLIPRAKQGPARARQPLRAPSAWPACLFGWESVM